MSLLVRPVETPKEYGAAFDALLQYFGRDPVSDEQIARFLKLLPLERMHGAFDGANVVGGAGAFELDLTVPGGVLPCAGVTVVGVSPTHRRRGLLTQMMRAQLEACRQRGDPLAALWASEETIYGRFGYGIAAWGSIATIPRADSAFALPFTPRGRFRLVSAQEALEPAKRVYAQVRAQRAGTIRRTDAWWADRRLGDPPDRRSPGAGPKRFVLLELDGEVRGFAIYRHHPLSNEAELIGNKTEVIEALATDGEADRELWRYLLDMDLCETTVAGKLAVDHPLLQLLARPRHARFQLADALWLRLVDVGQALSRRHYAAGEPLVFEVRDAFCPWNAGRWRLADGQATRTEAAADLALDVSALGAAYLGGVRFRSLADGLRVEERTPGAIARADALFHTERLPWCPEQF